MYWYAVKYDTFQPDDLRLKQKIFMKLKNTKLQILCQFLKLLP